MNLNEIVSVSGLPGLYQVHKKRNDGLIIKSLADEKVFFAPSRNHAFTPLENITIYTETDPVELVDVFRSIKKNLDKNPLPVAKSNPETLRGFFEVVLPNHDREKVYNSDISKIVKMFQLLDSKGLVVLEEPKESNKKTETKKDAETPETVVSEVENGDTETKKTAKKTTKATAKVEKADSETDKKEAKPAAKKTAKKTEDKG